jgi:hypothetical protein
MGPGAKGHPGLEPEHGDSGGEHRDLLPGGDYVESGAETEVVEAFLPGGVPVLFDDVLDQEGIFVQALFIQPGDDAAQRRAARGFEPGTEQDTPRGARREGRGPGLPSCQNRGVWMFVKVQTGVVFARARGAKLVEKVGQGL